MATVSNWNPFGVSLNITATSGTVKRTTATKFTVVLNVSWEVYYSGNKTNYGMSATSGGVTKTISAFDGSNRSSGSATFTGTYSISGNSGASKTISVTFKNFKTDNGDSATKSISLSVNVPAWTSYKITYNANGGTGSVPSAQTKWKGQTLTLSKTPIPTKSGYTFVGWNTSKTATSKIYDPGDEFKVDAATTLYAIWSKAIKLTYDANGGSGAPSATTNTVYNSTTSYTFTISSTKPTKSGYTFVGWNTSKTATSKKYDPGDSLSLSSNTTLYAIWSKAIKLTYDANGGSGAPSATTNTVYNSTTSATFTVTSTIPTKSGYTFLGWSKDSKATSASYSKGNSLSLSSNTTLYAIWKISYVPPKINSYSVKRCTSGGTVSSNGTYALVSFDWVCNKTLTKILIEWNSIDGEVSGSKTFTDSDTSFSEVVGNNTLSTDKSFTIKVTVTDSGGNSYKSLPLNSIAYPIEVVHDNGKDGIAFGKSAELTGYMDVGYAAKFNKNIHITNGNNIYGYNQAGDVKSAFIAQNSNGNTVVGYGNYSDFNEGKYNADNNQCNTNIYGGDINFGVSNLNGTTRFYQPYCRQGDARLDFTINTAGYVTNSGKQVAFFVPFAKPIIGSPLATVDSYKGFLLRQDGHYTHGSAWNGEKYEYVFPTSYSADVSPSHGYGVYISATFDESQVTNTNVINNAPIGIVWSGYITFS